MLVGCRKERPEKGKQGRQREWTRERDRGEDVNMYWVYAWVSMPPALRPGCSEAAVLGGAATGRERERER